jgi:hypothetical protein
MELISTGLAIVAIAVILYILFKVFKFITRLILIVIFLVLAYVTNPSIIRHQAAIDARAEKTNASLKGWDLKVTDLRIASITKITDGTETKIVGLGAFTRVWIFRNVP